MTSVPEWLTGIGTLALAAVAVGIPYLERLRAKRRRPHLVIEFGPEREPDVRLRVDPGGTGVSSYFITFRVGNVGRTAATGVRAQLRDYVAAVNPSINGRTAAHRVLDSQPLAWASRPASLGPELREQVVIPAGETDVAMAARFTVKTRELSIPPLSGEPFSPRIGGITTAVGHWLSVTVTADNADPASAVLWFETPNEGDRYPRVRRQSN